MATNGWFVVGLSRELLPGELRTIHYFGRDLVLFRTEGGEARVFDAHCPHLGAHFGYGGCVVGETLRCPFHHFRFDGSGACVEAPFAQKPPAIRARSWPVHETDGLIFVHHHAGGADPTWLPSTHLGPDWSPLETYTLVCRFHPQEVVENSVDATHAVFLHGYLQPTRITNAREEGPIWRLTWETELSAEYAAAQATGGATDHDAPVELPGGPRESKGRPLHVTLDLIFCALGWVEVHHTMETLGWPGLNRYCFTPIDDEQFEFRFVFSVKPPAGTNPEFVRSVTQHVKSFSVRDARQDNYVFEHKRYLTRPGLASLDALVPRVRQWAKQFYPEVHLDDHDEPLVPLRAGRTQAPGHVPIVLPPTPEVPAETPKAPPPVPALARPTTVREVFERYLPGIFQLDASAGRSFVVQYDIDGDGPWVLGVGDGKFESHPGAHPSPDVRIGVSSEDWVSIHAGKLSGAEAFMGGRLKVDGDLSLAMTLASVFPVPPAA
jgi:phenylpropionate dioxygenase-like ring-hydroxylating dioxygenase large terminal subunit